MMGSPADGDPGQQSDGDVVAGAPEAARLSRMGADISNTSLDTSNTGADAPYAAIKFIKLPILSCLAKHV